MIIWKAFYYSQIDPKTFLERLKLGLDSLPAGLLVLVVP